MAGVGGKALVGGVLVVSAVAAAMGAGLFETETEAAEGARPWFANAAEDVVLDDELYDDVDEGEALEDTDADSLVVLDVPPAPPPAPAPPYLAEVPEDAFRKALAFHFDAPVYERPDSAGDIVGFVRRNTQLPVARIVSGSNCQGTWYEVDGPGYVCSYAGFSVSTSPTPLEAELHVEPPDVAAALPYGYAKVETQGAPLFRRIPTPKEDAAAREGSNRAVKERLEGAVFVAIAQRLQDEGRRFVRTVRGYYVAEKDLRMLEPSPMHGEHLGGASGRSLPLAFVRVPETPLLDPDTGEMLGTALHHARVGMNRLVTTAERTLVITADGHAIDRAAVRVVDRVERPEKIPADAKWIHVDLAEQALVAYEGDEPVMATLVSSGKEGFEPPLGVFRVHKKHVTRTMTGPDPDAGTYEVGQVPWTMYYWGSFALHGAYWHDDFGNVRSHGCTNIPPLDARWLFYWSDPALPAGWHALIGRKGPWLYFTGAREDDAPTE